MNINDIKAALAQRANGLKMPVMTGATAPIPADNAAPDNDNNAAPVQEAASTEKPDVKAEAADNTSAIQASVKVAEEKPKRTRKTDRNLWSERGSRTISSKRRSRFQLSYRRASYEKVFLEA